MPRNFGIQPRHTETDPDDPTLAFVVIMGVVALICLAGIFA